MRDLNSCYPDCSSTRAEVLTPWEPQPLPELTDDEKARSLSLIKRNNFNLVYR
jgi:hypothetical protein